MAKTTDKDFDETTTTVKDSKNDGWNDKEDDVHAKGPDGQPSRAELAEDAQEARDDFEDADKNRSDSIEQAKADAANNHMAETTQAS